MRTKIYSIVLLVHFSFLPNLYICNFHPIPSDSTSIVLTNLPSTSSQNQRLTGSAKDSNFELTMPALPTEPRYDDYAFCVLGHGPNERNPDCQICMLGYSAENETVTHNACRNTFHKGCFDQWCRIKECDGVAVTCPKCRAVLDHLHGTGVYHDDGDRSHAGSVHFGGWANDYFQPYQIQNHLQLRYIPDLSDLRTYNDHDLTTRRSASDSYVYEIAPDMFHRGIMRELPRSGNKSATQGSPHRGFAVEDLYMDDQSYQRYLLQVRHWQVDKYEVYWAPPLWDIDFLPHTCVSRVSCWRSGMEQ
jgi:hypothetical protein